MVLRNRDLVDRERERELAESIRNSTRTCTRVAVIYPYIVDLDFCHVSDVSSVL